MGTARNELFKQVIIMIINRSHISKTSYLSFIMSGRSVYMTGLQTFEKKYGSICLALYRNQLLSKKEPMERGGLASPAESFPVAEFIVKYIFWSRVVCF